MSFTIDPGVRTETTIRPDHATVFVSLELSRSKGFWLTLEPPEPLPLTRSVFSPTRVSYRAAGRSCPNRG